MSLLTICQDAADEIGIAAPSSVIGNTEPDVQKLFRMVRKVNQRLTNRIQWNSLRRQREYTLIGQSEQTDIFPTDLQRMIPETFWNVTQQFNIAGPKTPVEWQSLRAQQYDNDVSSKYTIQGRRLFMIPNPRAGDKSEFEFQSNEIVVSETGTPQTEWLSNTDLPVIDGELLTYGVIYMFQKSEGLEYLDSYNEFMDYLQIAIGNSRQAEDVMVAADFFNWTRGRHFDGQPYAGATRGWW